MLTTQNLTKTVSSQEQDLTILSEVTLTINEGDIVAIIGASGSGKSTLLSLLAGLDVPTSGEVILANHKLHELDEDERAGVRAQFVGFIFQSFHLLPGLTALENVMLPIELKGGKSPRKDALAILDKVGLSERVKHYPNQLSGGEQQRVAIARAFASEPKILFADEPTGNLDSANGQKVVDLLFELNEQFGTTLVLVTHDQNLANRCDRQLSLEAGRLVADTSEQLDSASSNPKATVERVSSQAKVAS